MPITELRDSILIIWSNVFKTQDYLAQYDAIACKADKLNENNPHFWGITQQSALNSVVLHICKLFDLSNKNYPKHAIPDIINILQKHLCRQCFLILDISLLSQLRISDEFIKEYVEFSKDSNQYNNPIETENIINKLANNLRDIYFPTQSESPKKRKIKGPHLEKIFEYRNKVLAHQEKLSCASKNTLSSLPSIEEMDKIASWAEFLCRFIFKIFFPNEELPSFMRYGGGETNKVIKLILDEGI